MVIFFLTILFCRLNNHLSALTEELKAMMFSHSTHLGIDEKVPGARLVSMETGQLLGLQEIHEALANKNTSVAYIDLSTGLVSPGPSTRISLASGQTMEVPPHHYIDLNAGNVLPIHGNVYFDPLTQKIIAIPNPPDISLDEMLPLIPFIPYPQNAITGEPLDIGLLPIDHTHQLKVGGAMRDVSTGLCVPVCAVTIHPQTKTLLPIGGTYIDHVTNVLVPIEMGSLMIDSLTNTPVPIVGVDFDPQSRKIVPIGGSLILGGESKVLLIGEEFIDPLSKLPVKLGSAILDSSSNKLVPVSRNYQSFLDSIEMDWHARLMDTLVQLRDLVQTIPNRQQEALIAENFEKIEAIFAKVTQARSNAQSNSIKMILKVRQQLVSCATLSETGGSPCYMEHKATGQPLPLLLGFHIKDPQEGISVPVLDYEISSVTGVFEPSHFTHSHTHTLTLCTP